MRATARDLHRPPSLPVNSGRPRRDRRPARLRTGRIPYPARSPSLARPHLWSSSLTSSITQDPGRFYGDTYYASYRGGTYERNDHWNDFFAGIARRIVDEIAPATVLDAGCAKGFLVEQLLLCGVDAEGVDISEHAIGDAPPEVRAHLRVGSLLEPLGRRYDLITCIEVIEHLEPRDAEAAVANLCAHTDDILLSSTPDEYREATHVNVRPAEHWAELFARNGFVRDVDYDAGYVSPWTARFRRSRDPWPRTAATYERALARLVAERHQRTELLLEQDQQLAERDRELDRLRRRITDLEGSPETSRLEIERLSRELSLSERQLGEAHRHIEHLDELRRREASEAAVHHFGAVARRAAQRVLPRDSGPGRVVRTAARAGGVLVEHGPVEVARRGRRRLLRAQLSTAVGAVNEAVEPVSEADGHYADWLERVEPDAEALRTMRAESGAWEDAPLVSVVMPVYNSDPRWLDAAIRSVVDQAYERWELCLADDASSDARVVACLQAWASADHRIHFRVREINGGIAAATNTALETAGGELVTFLDHDDVLRPHALFEVARFFRDHPDQAMAYTDEDHIRPDGVRFDPYLKGGYSRDLLLSNNYLCHLLTIRRSLLTELGGIREGFDGAQDHDLVLRASEKGNVGHIGDVLYSWRQVPGSTALRGSEKDYAWDAGVRAIEDALTRRGTPGRVEKGSTPGWYTVRYKISGTPLVSIVIPTRDRVDLLRVCVRSIEQRTDWTNWRLVIVDNGSVEEETLEYLASLRHEVVRDPDYFNYSRIINRGVRATDGEHVLFLNNDVEVVSPEWMTAMLEHSQRPEVGGVGARLLYPDGRPQHEGVRIGGGILAGNIDHVGYYNLGESIREVSAVTAACMMMRREVFDRVGGFDERLRVAFNDVDLCLRIRKLGYSIIYQPLARLYHFESATRGRLHPMADERLLISTWGDADTLVDPYVSPRIKGYSPLTLKG